MVSQKCLVLVVTFLFLLSVCTAEFVPVYMWGTRSAGEPVPALHKISQSSFKDEMVNNLKTNSKIIVFAEHSLSPEDFGQRDRSGDVSFPNLSKARRTSKVTYLSYVQNPVKAIQHSSEDVAEITIGRLRENFEIPDSKIVIIDLNDAAENERRFDMLKRHDEFIASLYISLLEKNENILAVYTAHHASWIGSGEIHSRRIRSLERADDSTPNQYISNSTILYYTSGNVTVVSGTTTTSVSVTYTASNLSDVITLSGTGDNGFSVSFEFTKSNNAYWYLRQANLSVSNVSLSQTTSGSIYAPLGFSYACGNQVFKSTNLSVTFPQFQVQPLYRSTYRTKDLQFDDPYNCVGFTTIPIWSGLFVTFILLLIMTFGITMMMDIKTMDRFDDAKGKTITINTSE